MLCDGVHSRRHRETLILQLDDKDKKKKQPFASKGLQLLWKAARPRCAHTKNIHGGRWGGRWGGGAADIRFTVANIKSAGELFDWTSMIKYCVLFRRECVAAPYVGFIGVNMCSIDLLGFLPLLETRDPKDQFHLLPLRN